jgi:hypothetical protein
MDNENELARAIVFFEFAIEQLDPSNHAYSYDQLQMGNNTVYFLKLIKDDWLNRLKNIERKKHEQRRKKGQTGSILLLQDEEEKRNVLS